MGVTNQLITGGDHLVPTCQACSRGAGGTSAAAQPVASSRTRDALGHGRGKQGALGLMCGL